MADWKELESKFAARLPMGRRPVAVTFLDAEPAGVTKFSGTEPAGCSFWRLAAAGQTFYTVPADHFNCAVGAFTHNIHVPPERVKETADTLGLMFDLGYVRPEEVVSIPRLPQEPAAVVYAPLGDTPVAPSVVIFTVRNSEAMCSSTKPRFTQAPARRCPCWAARVAWRFPPRSRTEPSRAWAVLETAYTPIWERAKFTSSRRAQSWKLSPILWIQLPPRTSRSKCAHAGSRPRSPQHNRSVRTPDIPVLRL